MAGKADIVDHLVNNVEGVTKKQAGEILDTVFDYIGSALVDGDRVQVPGFGTFQISERAERQGLNPKTKAPITIPASKGVRFKPGKALKDSVNA
jgi:DNA-binding protein HU-beta